MNEKFSKKFQMFLVITFIDGVSFKIFHSKLHTWKNNNQIAKNGNFEPLYLGNPLWSRQSADVGFLYGSISITIYRSHFGCMDFFFCNTVLLMMLLICLILPAVSLRGALFLASFNWKQLQPIIGAPSSTVSRYHWTQSKNSGIAPQVIFPAEYTYS